MLGNLFLSEFLTLLFVGLTGSFVIESLLQPKVIPVWKRGFSAFFIHLGIFLLIFSVLFALLLRPWFSIVIVLAFTLFVVLVNNAKFHSLREPFIYQDFEYFTDAIKHPRLYIPFLGLIKAVIIFISFSAAFLAGLVLESPVNISAIESGGYSFILEIFLCGLVLLWLGAKKKLAIVFDPVIDLNKLGLVSSLWRYAEEERDIPSIDSEKSFIKESSSPDRLENLVVVQSESFFDIRRLFSGINKNVLQEFDELQATATLHGQVEVAAWGANTVRTEFSFLSGLPASQLGVHQFNPYRKLAKQGDLSTLASFMKKKGYRTVCVHPYQASFYARNKVFPKLGFDEFIDISHFKNTKKTGPYIGDIALANKVCSILDESSDQPVFVFVITMENHGPLHMEKVEPTDIDKLYTDKLPEGCDDLTIYLRHILNADRMAAILRDKISSLPRSGWLCWYGDHVPIMPSVYSIMGVPEGETDYFIWGSAGKMVNRNKRVKIESLANFLLHEMKFLFRLKD